MTDELNYIDVEGIRIPIITMEQRVKQTIKPVYDYFQIELKDPVILLKVAEYFSTLINSQELTALRFHLWDAPILNLPAIREAIIYSSINLLLSDTWNVSHGRLLTEIANQTRDEDYLLQHWFNYENWILEYVLTLEGCKIICSIYDLRGLDFFLFHYMGGETSALKDNALFSNAANVPIALQRLGREEEAILARNELQDRINGLTAIRTDFEFRQDDQGDFLILEKLRLRAERFWHDYLSSDVWSTLHSNSRNELIDAFISEKFLMYGILRGWNLVILALCKVVERELAITIFNPWIEDIKFASFLNEETAGSSSKKKRIQSCKFTFDILKSCVKDPIHPPTLGQLIFMAKFWDNDVMDSCTDLFKIIRNKVNNYIPDYTNMINRLVDLLEYSYTLPNEKANITELRNASAHPGKEDSLNWPLYLDWLKESMGKPPKQMLHTITIDLRLSSAL